MKATASLGLVPPKQKSGSSTGATTSPLAGISKLPRVPSYSGSTMGKGHGKAARPDVDHFHWLASVDEGIKREPSPASESRGRSASGKRTKMGRSSSRPKESEESKVPTSLQGE